MPRSARKEAQEYRELFRGIGHKRKTLAIVTCKMLRDDPKKRSELDCVKKLLASKIFIDLVKSNNWRLACTGGTHAAIAPALKRALGKNKYVYGLAPSALGIIQLASLIVSGHVFAVLFFNDMEDYYADSPQNLCLRRICNELDVPLFEDFTSVEYIINHWKKSSRKSMSAGGTASDTELGAYFGMPPYDDKTLFRKDLSPLKRANRSRETLALISHNDKKMEMLNFCLAHMGEILQYRRVLTTGTTGEKIFALYVSALSTQCVGCSSNSPMLKLLGLTPPVSEADIRAVLDKKIQRFESGPKGGDVQISARVIDGCCHRVVFFQDPQTAHPHQFDIRLMEKAVQDQETAVLFATSPKMAEQII